ncbi:hypothetical protein LCGC14_1173280 [marine sediment metagenome]|uniref:Uncharacterized protein n=1 Tax=marine sediment metagenome TaxID=412755 RepID=A0A0F9LU48_9ZZZZ
MKKPKILSGRRQVATTVSKKVQKGKKLNKYILELETENVQLRTNLERISALTKQLDIRMTQRHNDLAKADAKIEELTQQTEQLKEHPLQVECPICTHMIEIKQ